MSEIGTGAGGARPLDGLREQVREAARAAAAHDLAPKPPRASEVTLSQHMDLSNANFMGNVHGGEIMKLIDTAAGIAASRHAGGPVVTASLDQMSFLHPVHVGDVVLVRASVNDVGRTSIEVGVRVEAEEILSGRRTHTSSAYLVFVALDERGQPRPVPGLVPETDVERHRQAEAKIRREHRLARAEAIRRRARPARRVSAATRPGDDGAVTPGQVLAGLLLAALVLWLLAPFAGVDPPGGLTASNAPWTDEGFNLANARERVLAGHFATGDVDRSLTNGAYSVLAAAMFTVTGPSLAAGRALSMVAVAAAVLLLALGLARPLGRPAALLAAASLGGANLVLEHGRLALVEATVVVLLAGAFVLATRAAWRPSLAAGAGVGLLVAAAVSVKAIALLPGMVMLAVVLVAAAVRRDRAAMGMGLAGLATLVLAGGAWLAAVALPNWDRFRTALAIWPRVEYLDSPVALAGRLGRYLADSDQALGRSLPLLVAAASGWPRWPGAGPAWPRRPGTPWSWPPCGGSGCGWRWRWPTTCPATTAPPTATWSRPCPGWPCWPGSGWPTWPPWPAGAGPRVAGVVGVVLGVAVAPPGVVAYLDGAMASGRSREQGQRVLATSLPEQAVVYGAYAPTLLFDTRLATLTPWPSAGANVGDPVGRLGVTHLLVGPVPSDPTSRVVALPGAGRTSSLARVRWGPGELFLYDLPGAGVSPVAAPIDYDPLAGPSRQT